MKTSLLLECLRDELAEGAEGNWTDLKLLRYLDRAYRIVASEEKLQMADRRATRGLIDLVASQELYSLPADLQSVKCIELLDEDGNYFTLHETTPQLRERHQETSASSTDGEPARWFWLGTQIALVPIPGSGMVSGLRITYIPLPGHIFAGTLTSADAASVTLGQDAEKTDDAYNGMVLDTGSCEGIITDYVGATRVASVVLTTVPAGGQPFDINPATSPELDDLIIIKAAEQALARIDPASSKHNAQRYQVERVRLLAGAGMRDRGPRYVHYLNPDDEL